MPRDSDQAQLQKLYAQSMPGRITLSLRADPDYRRALDIQGDRHDTVIVRQRDNGQAVAMGSRSVHPLWINGDIQRVGYLSSLRNSPGVRLPRRLVAEAFNWLLDQRRSDEAEFDLTSILTDNHTARRALERGVKGMPRYTPIGEFNTCAFRAVEHKPLAACRRLTERDTPALEALLCQDHHGYHARPAASFSPSSDTPHQSLAYESDGQLLGVAILWDQRAIKQTVVEDLSAPLKRYRRVINLGCRVLGRPGLPRPGESVAAVYGTHLAFPEEQPRVLRHLIRALQAEAFTHQADTLIVGLTPTQHQQIRSHLRRQAWVTPSVIYAVHRGGAPELDQQTVWPEVALL
ncbi:MAG: hypothetical protein AAGA25_06780 [Planctomycetota bacterium]